MSEVDLNQFGSTRGASHPSHLLQTPDTFIRAPLPGMQNATAVVHCAPALGAQFTQYSVEMERGGTLGPAPAQRFVYVAEGKAVLHIHSKEQPLEPGSYAYLPDKLLHNIKSLETTRLVLIERNWQPEEQHAAPPMIVGKESAVQAQPLLGDPDVQVKTLLPGEPSFDFAVNIMTFRPGASLSMVEMHVMEHGLLMLEGGGIYRLGEHWYPVQTGDFIWMAPFCPQWFGALGKKPAKYIIYKDWNRHPLR